MPAGAISYRMETALGVRNDVLFVYDLEVPAEFTPRNTDGEIVAFALMDAADVIERVRAGDDFKFNVNLVIIDFALRHGLVTPAEPDYLELVIGLHRPWREAHSASLLRQTLYQRPRCVAFHALSPQSCSRRNSVRLSWPWRFDRSEGEQDTSQCRTQSMLTVRSGRTNLTPDALPSLR